MNKISVAFSALICHLNDSAFVGLCVFDILVPASNSLNVPTKEREKIIHVNNNIPFTVDSGHFLLFNVVTVYLDLLSLW